MSFFADGTNIYTRLSSKYKIYQQRCKKLSMGSGYSKVRKWWDHITFSKEITWILTVRKSDSRIYSGQSDRKTEKRTDKCFDRQTDSQTKIQT